MSLRGSFSFSFPPKRKEHAFSLFFSLEADGPKNRTAFPSYPCRRTSSPLRILGKNEGGVFPPLFPFSFFPSFDQDTRKKQARVAPGSQKPLTSLPFFFLRFPKERVKLLQVFFEGSQSGSTVERGRFLFPLAFAPRTKCA